MVSDDCMLFLLGLRKNFVFANEILNVGRNSAPARKNPNGVKCSDQPAMNAKLIIQRSSTDYICPVENLMYLLLKTDDVTLMRECFWKENLPPIIRSDYTLFTSSNSDTSIEVVYNKEVLTKIETSCKKTIDVIIRQHKFFFCV